VLRTKHKHRTSYNPPVDNFNFFQDHGKTAPQQQPQVPMHVFRFFSRSELISKTAPGLRKKCPTRRSQKPTPSTKILKNRSPFRTKNRTDIAAGK
jgi:hypothetical protein